MTEEQKLEYKHASIQRYRKVTSRLTIEQLEERKRKERGKYHSKKLANALSNVKEKEINKLEQEAMTFLSHSTTVLPADNSEDSDHGDEKSDTTRPTPRVACNACKDI